MSTVDSIHKRKAILWALTGLIVLLVVVALRIFTIWATALPLDARFPLAERSHIEQSIEMRTGEFDTLAVVFSTAEHPLYDVRKVAGGPVWENEKWVEYPPLPIAVDWKVMTPAGEVVRGGRASLQNLITSYGSDEITRELVRIPLEPGRYRFEAKVVEPEARFADIPTRLVFVAEGKGVTWQSGVAWWGSIISFLVAIPLLLACAMLFLFHYTRWRYGQPSVSED